MKYTILTSLIIRLAGFALFVKIFDFFGSYFVSIYLTASISVMDESHGMADSFDKLFISGTILAFANLFLSLVLILKSDWIANKLVKTESEIKIDLTAKSVMRIIIAVLGIIYCARTLYHLSSTFENVMAIINWKSDESYAHLIASLISFCIRAMIGALFIFKSEQLANYVMKRRKSL
jgi:hypothetical protein